MIINEQNRKEEIEIRKFGKETDAQNVTQFHLTKET